MKRKYYLRGLGLGILITSLVFVVAGPSEPTEEEIIKRAEKLGYVKAEEDSDSGINIKELLGTGTPDPSPTEKTSATETPIPTEDPEETPVPSPAENEQTTETPAPTFTPTPTPIPTPTPTLTPVPTEAIQPTATSVPTSQPTKVPENITVTANIAVERGNSAIKVCEKIELAGILRDGDVLLNYLINNNLVDHINVGTYTMSSDMTLEEMAKLLTGR